MPERTRVLRGGGEPACQAARAARTASAGGPDVRWTVKPRGFVGPDVRGTGKTRGFVGPDVFGGTERNGGATSS